MTGHAVAHDDAALKAGEYSRAARLEAGPPEELAHKGLHGGRVDRQREHQRGGHHRPVVGGGSTTA